jgi:YggT family protein
MINQVLIPILVLLANVISTVVLVSFVLGLLVAFNVVSMSNRFVASLMQALDAILTPILRPVRRIMPPTGGIDFSPIVLLVLIKIVLIILSYLGTQFE